MKGLMLFILLFAFNAHADNNHNVESLPRIVWLDQQGEVVPDDVIDAIADQCGIDQAAHRIANINGGDIESAIDEYKAAVACFEEHGFTKQIAK
ncbi:hypothetical protein [Enterovibrio sp. 27052020O]|uniref:hypothetical protein n=1 Tax=Enterovibrio sp. 27052020O TaxID=3241166 RepID=UPI0038902955